MKIKQFGVVILTKDAVKVEGWKVEPEPSDPPDATPEQMLLEVTIPWAQQKLNEAIMNNLRRIAQERKAAANPTTATGAEVQ